MIQLLCPQSVVPKTCECFQQPVLRQTSNTGHDICARNPGHHSEVPQSLDPETDAEILSPVREASGSRSRTRSMLPKWLLVMMYSTTLPGTFARGTWSSNTASFAESSRFSQNPRSSEPSNRASIKDNISPWPPVFARLSRNRRLAGPRQTLSIRSVTMSAGLWVNSRLRICDAS